MTTGYARAGAELAVGGRVGGRWPRTNGRGSVAGKGGVRECRGVEMEVDGPGEGGSRDRLSVEITEGAE